MAESYVTANGIRFHCLTAGKGPLILLLHGFPEFSYAWKDQLREFGGDHLVVAPDLRGYNLTDKPVDVAAYRVAILIEDIRQLADHFREGRKFVLVGHDWGGAIAWGFAIEHPEYLEKLVIINAPFPPIFWKLLSSDAEQQQASQYMLLFRSPGAEALLSANNYAILTEKVLGDLLESGALAEHDKASYLSAWSRPGALTGGLNYYRANHIGPPVPDALQSQLGRSDAIPHPADSQVRVPTLVIWGERDEALTVKNLDGLEHYVPQLTVKRFPEASHWVVHEQPEAVNAALRTFLGTSASASGSPRE